MTEWTTLLVFLMMIMLIATSFRLSIFATLAGLGIGACYDCPAAIGFGIPGALAAAGSALFIYLLDTQERRKDQTP